MLNLALVDIGAGTSDIAITKEGSVMAYGMIPIAGDEVTEKLVHTYLVDFKTAEAMKEQLATSSVIEFEDIIGISHQVAADEMREVVTEIIQRLGSEIASKIIALNGDRSPNAVFCVGGGSQTPYITSILADKLAILPERVSIRSSEHAMMVIDEGKEIQGPESITPLGICLTTMEKRENDFMSIKVNGKIIDLLQTKKMTIADAVIAIGLDHTQIISVRGKTLMFHLNNKRIRIKGGIGSQPTIIRNKQEATLDTKIAQGDELKIYPAQNGEDGQATIASLIVQNGFSKENLKVRVNDQPVDHTYKIKNGDEVIIEDSKEEEQDSQQINDKLEEKMVHVTVNGELVSIPYKKDLVFITIFDYIDFDLSTPQGNIVLKLNGDRASYTDSLSDGDQIDVYWE